MTEHEKTTEPDEVMLMVVDGNVLMLEVQKPVVWVGYYEKQTKEMGDECIFSTPLGVYSTLEACQRMLDKVGCITPILGNDPVVPLTDWYQDEGDGGWTRQVSDTMWLCAMETVIDE